MTCIDGMSIDYRSQILFNASIFLCPKHNVLKCHFMYSQLDVHFEEFSSCLLTSSSIFCQFVYFFVLFTDEGRFRSGVSLSIFLFTTRLVRLLLVQGHPICGILPAQGILCRGAGHRSPLTSSVLCIFSSYLSLLMLYYCVWLTGSSSFQHHHFHELEQKNSGS